MMLVDCNTCPVRHVRCADCMVTALLTVPHPAHETPPPVLAEAVGAGDAPVGLALDRAERHAVSVLLGAGLVSVAEANAARALPSEVGQTAAAGAWHQAHPRSTGATGSAGSTRASGPSRSARSSRAAG
ncbi:hypothetical protein [Humibacillus xanthopallidus]|uniref:hypothetical protein n=1 Tax=Humibacillus xanthopallidus TaxID=412689 RepID=UPI00384D8001